MRPGQSVRLVFPSKRLTVDGPDETWFWQKWTGVPFDGRLLARFKSGAAPVPWEDVAWEADVAPVPAGERLPASIAAHDARGNRLRLTQTTERPARETDTWPAAPPTFRLEQDVAAEGRP